MDELGCLELGQNQQEHSEEDKHSHADREAEDDGEIEVELIQLLILISVGPSLHGIVCPDVANDKENHDDLQKNDETHTSTWLDKPPVSLETHNHILIFLF